MTDHFIRYVPGPSDSFGTAVKGSKILTADGHPITGVMSMTIESEARGRLVAVLRCHVVIDPRDGKPQTGG